MQFLELLFGHIVNDKEMSFKDSAKSAYDTALGVHHSFMVRAGAKTGLSLAPKREFVLENVFKDQPDLTEEEQDDKLRELTTKMNEVMKPFWELYEQNSWLDIK